MKVTSCTLASVAARANSEPCNTAVPMYSVTPLSYVRRSVTCNGRTACNWLWVLIALIIIMIILYIINPLTPNDPHSGRTAPLTSKRCILYIYSTNIGTEYFKHGIYSQFFPSSKCSLFHNSNVFGSCIIHILYTGCAKIKKNNSVAKILSFSF